MIYIKDKKAVLCRGNFRPAQFYKGDKKIAGYEMVSFEGDGEVSLENSYNDKIYNAKITGNCFQEETPSPENPVSVMCVGDLVTEGEHNGKYKIGVVAYNGNSDEEHFDIYLDEPLCKIGAYEDYIDFENKKVIRNTSTRIFKGTESWYRENFRLYCECGKRSGLKSAEVNCIANRYRAYPWNTIYRNVTAANKTIGVALQSGSYLCITPEQVVPAVDEWKAQLAAWNDEGKPLTVVYADSEREEDINIPTLPTFKGATHYEVLTDVNTKISGEYKRME